MCACVPVNERVMRVIFVCTTFNQIRIVKLNKVLMGGRAICISLSYETCFFTSFKRYSIKEKKKEKKKNQDKRKWKKESRKSLSRCIKKLNLSMNYLFTGVGLISTIINVLLTMFRSLWKAFRKPRYTSRNGCELFFILPNSEILSITNEKESFILSILLSNTKELWHSFPSRSLL